MENTRPTPPNLHTAHAHAMFGMGDTARGLDALERATTPKSYRFGASWRAGLPLPESGEAPGFGPS
jgi:hypothetical protein